MSRVSDFCRSVGLARLGSDMFAIGLGQVFAFVYPLVSIPFLSRTLGAAGLGRALLAIATVQLIVLAVDFGFGMSAMRRVALAASRAELQRITFSTLVAKCLLLLVVALILAPLIIWVPMLHNDWQLYVVGTVLTIGAVAFPTWLLQGMGRMKTFALISASSRMLALAALLATIRSDDDIVLAVTWQFAPASIAALMSWLYLKRSGFPRFQMPRPVDVIEALRESWPLFISSAATTVVASMNTIFLGALSTIHQVAFYGAAERLSNAGRGIIGGVQQSLLPRMSVAVSDSHNRAMRRLIFLAVFSCYAIGGILLMAFAGVLIPWYLGGGFEAAIPVGRLLGLALAITGVSAALTLTLIARGHANISARVMVVAAAMHVVVLPIGCLVGGAIGASCAVIFTESAIAIMLALASNRLGPVLSVAATPDTAAAEVTSNPATINSFDPIPRPAQ